MIIANEGFRPQPCSDQVEQQLQDDRPLLEVMRFNSHEDFMKVTNRIPEMSQQQLDKWETENSFKSYRTVLKDAYKELEIIATSEEYLNFLKKYDDVFILRDSTLIPRIDIENLQAFVNREGLYETSGYLNKVVGNYILTVKIKRFYYAEQHKVSK